MVSTATGVAAPLPDDAFDPQGDMRRLALSLAGHVIIPVANITERAAVGGLLAAQGTGVSPSNPIYVHRFDAGAGRELEWSPDGANWRTVGSRIDVAGSPAAAQRAVYQKAGDVIAATNSNGDGSITFAEPFPNQLFTATVTDATDPGVLGPVLIKYTAATSNSTRITFRAYTTSGAALAGSAGLRIAYTAVGY